MLIITRNRGQSIKIGEDITIRFLRYDEGKDELRIGIDAPDDVLIVRTEIAYGFERELRKKLSTVKDNQG